MTTESSPQLFNGQIWCSGMHQFRLLLCPGGGWCRMSIFGNPLIKTDEDGKWIYTDEEMRGLLEDWTLYDDSLTTESGQRIHDSHLMRAMRESREANAEKVRYVEKPV